jgi:class 3 adenylate cyclase
MTPRVLAILFADVCGSTALYERLGDQGALSAVASVIDVLRGATDEARGRLVKTIGDEIMTVFPDAAAAAQAAMDMQSRVSQLPPFGDARLAVRIGFHLGPVLEEAGDVFGDTVNTAARLAALAKPGQIVTSAAGVAGLPVPLQETTRDLDALPLKGKQEELRVHELLWQDAEELTQTATRAPLRQGAEARLHVTHAERTLTLGPDLPVVLIGRDRANQIVIAHRTASRLHGRFERRRDQFFYVDLSTNGTYVALPGQAEILLRREQVLLAGQGTLAIGHASSDARAEILRFSVE